MRTGSHFSKTRAADPPSLRVMSTQNIFPALRHRDAHAALAWLTEASAPRSGTSTATATAASTTQSWSSRTA